MVDSGVVPVDSRRRAGDRVAVGVGAVVSVGIRRVLSMGRGGGAGHGRSRSQSVRRSSGTNPSPSAPGRLWSLNTPANHSRAWPRGGRSSPVPEAAAAGGRRRCAEGERGDAVGDEGHCGCDRLRTVPTDEEAEALVFEQRGGGERPDRRTLKPGQRVGLDGRSFPDGEVDGEITRRTSTCGGRARRRETPTAAGGPGAADGPRAASPDHADQESAMRSTSRTVRDRRRRNARSRVNESSQSAGGRVRTAPLK